MKGNKLNLFIGWSATLGILGITTYPIIIEPILNPEKYRKIQEITRKGINPEDIQPGHMPVWRDPFDRKKSEKNT